MVVYRNGCGYLVLNVNNGKRVSRWKCTMMVPKIWSCGSDRENEGEEEGVVRNEKVEMERERKLKEVSQQSKI